MVTDALPVIKDTDLLKAELTGLIASIGSAFQQTPLNRVAAYLQLGQEASDFQQANQILSEGMWQHLKVPLKDEEDFVMQINRTRADASIKLNFITKWSVERVQVLTFEMSPGGQGPVNTPRVVEKIIPTISLDNSNVPLQKPLDQNETGRVLSQVFEGMTAQLKECRVSLKGF
jgi:hypothetical protein